MTELGQLVHLLRNTPVREIIRALERDNFSLRRTTQTGGHIYVHREDKTRRTAIHYHHGSDILKRKTLESVLQGTRWTKEDLKRLKLIK